MKPCDHGSASACSISGGALRRGRGGVGAGSRSPLLPRRGSSRSPRRRSPRAPPGERLGGRPERDLPAVEAENLVPGAAWSRSCVAIRIPRALGGELGQELLEQLGARLVDARERLVEEQDRRVLDERAGDERALALAARELAELRARERGEPHAIERLEREAPVSAARPSPPRQARERPHQRHVERADRVVEPRALGLRQVAEAADPVTEPRAARARRAGRGRASTCRRRSARAR